MEIYIKILSKHIRVYGSSDIFIKEADTTNQFNFNMNHVTQHLLMRLVSTIVLKQ